MRIISFAFRFVLFFHSDIMCTRVDLYRQCTFVHSSKLYFGDFSFSFKFKVFLFFAFFCGCATQALIVQVCTHFVRIWCRSGLHPALVLGAYFYRTFALSRFFSFHLISFGTCVCLITLSLHLFPLKPLPQLLIFCFWFSPIVFVLSFLFCSVHF